MKGTHDLLSLGHIWFTSNTNHSKFPPNFSKKHTMKSQVGYVNTTAHTLHVWLTTQVTGIWWLQVLFPSLVSRKLTRNLRNSFHLFRYQHTLRVCFRFSIYSYYTIIFIKKPFQLSCFPFFVLSR